MKKIIFACMASTVMLIASSAFADDSCKLPGDIDEGEWYRFELAHGGSLPPMLIVDIDDCWIETKMKKDDKNSSYYSIRNIIKIGW